MAVMLTLLVATGLLVQVAEGSPHDKFQAKTQVHHAPQDFYKAAGPGEGFLGRRLSSSNALPTCEEISESAETGPLRVGFELVEVDVVAQELQDYTTMIMEHATAYLGTVLNVRRTNGPIFAEYSQLNAIVGDPDDPIRLSKAAVSPPGLPTCGTDGVQIPEKYMRPTMACDSYCRPNPSCADCAGSGDTCDCNAEDWLDQKESYCCKVGGGCGSMCGLADGWDPAKLSIRKRIGKGAYAVCHSGCQTYPGGEGLVDKDIMILVTIKETEDCALNSKLHAYATHCAVDQCDRPIFGHINFCMNRLAGDVANPSKIAASISTAVHEVAHVLVFSSTLYPYFRDNKGVPRVPRTPENSRVFEHSVRFMCNANNELVWNQQSGQIWTNLTGAVIDYFDERGFSNCGCPRQLDDVDTKTCLPSMNATFQVPHCSTKVITPMVKYKARQHFDCPDLEGAELENQDTTDCVIAGSHWEARLFNGELMAAVNNEGAFLFVSDVTLALFEDSGWYLVNWEQADTLTKDVHWGFEQGCAFSRDKKCVENGESSWPKAFCTEEAEDSCSLHRLGAMRCSLMRADYPVPKIFDYFGGANMVGLSSVMDYCPAYEIRHSNRVCVDQTSVSRASPPSAQRELFGAKSRCFMSDLHEFAYSEMGISDAPLCFETECAADGKSYKIGISDDNGGVEWIDKPCTRRGDELRKLGFGGRVICAHPAEICQVAIPVHLRNLSQAIIDAGMGINDLGLRGPSSYSGSMTSGSRAGEATGVSKDAAASTAPAAVGALLVGAIGLALLGGAAM